MTNEPASETRDHRFLVGLIAGAVLGAGLGMLFAPRAALELRRKLAGSAEGIRKAASERYHQAGDRLGAAAVEVAAKGQAMRDSLADSVVRGAQKVEAGAQNVQQYATGVKTHKLA